jgi:uncharacterized coiled-coil protein SlyX
VKVSEAATKEVKRVMASLLENALDGTQDVELGLDPAADPAAAGADPLSAPAGGGGLGDIGGSSTPTGAAPAPAGVGMDPLAPAGVIPGGVEDTAGQEKTISPEDEEVLAGISAALQGANVSDSTPLAEEVDLKTGGLKSIPNGRRGNSENDLAWGEAIEKILKLQKGENDELKKRNKELADKTEEANIEINRLEERISVLESKFYAQLKVIKDALTESATHMAKAHYVWKVVRDRRLSEAKKSQALEDLEKCATLNEAKVYYKSLDNVLTKESVASDGGAARNHLSNSGTEAKMREYLSNSASRQDASVGSAQSGSILESGQIDPKKARMREMAGIRNDYED